MVIRFTYVTLGFLDPLHCLWAPLAHFFLLGHLWSICFPWASSTHFLILHSHRLLLALLGFPWPNYYILHLWGLWAFHHPLLSYITPSLFWSILTFLHHIMPMGLLFLSLGSFRPICFPQGPFTYFMGM